MGLSESAGRAHVLLPQDNEEDAVDQTHGHHTHQVRRCCPSREYLERRAWRTVWKKPLGAHVYARTTVALALGFSLVLI